MKSWLRFFGLSFFSDKIAKEARFRGVMNCVLGFVLALLFTFLGVLAANTVPFSTHYGNSEDFKKFIVNFVADARLSVKDGRVSAESLIDTFANESDAEKYAINGYNLVIDTRHSTALDDFEVYYAPKSGGTGEISYGEYQALSDGEKENYVFRIRYTENELILTDELVKGYESYLGASEDENIKKQYSALTAKKDDLTEDEYKNSVYTLYINAYYPELSAIDSMPLLRGHYFINYIYEGKTAKVLYVFDDMLVGYFDTYGGISQTFYGLFDNLPDGVITADTADEFICGAFSAAVSMMSNVYLMNIFRFIPFIALIPLLCALVAKLVFMLTKNEKLKKYTTCVKMEFSYLLVGSLIAALAVFICGFFLSTEALNAVPIIVLAVVILLRTAALLVCEYLRGKNKSPAEPAEDEDIE